MRGWGGTGDADVHRPAAQGRPVGASFRVHKNGSVPGPGPDLRSEMLIKTVHVDCALHRQRYAAEIAHQCTQPYTPAQNP